MTLVCDLYNTLFNVNCKLCLIDGQKYCEAEFLDIPLNLVCTHHPNISNRFFTNLL